MEHRNEYIFTSESVGEGHPDKVCDQVSDAVLDDALRQDPASHVACETFATTGMVLVGQWNSRFTHLPINLAVGKRKTLSPEDPLWLSVLESTGQPAHIG